MTDHLARRNAVRAMCDRRELEEAIERCNLRPEYRKLLRVLYLDGGCAGRGVHGGAGSGDSRAGQFGKFRRGEKGFCVRDGADPVQL